MKKIFLASFCFAFLQAFAFEQTFTVAQDGSGCFLSLKEALDRIPYHPADDETVCIIVKSGIYKEKLVIHEHQNNVIVMGENAENTIIVWDDHTGKVVNGDTLNTYSSPTLSIRSDNVIFKNITIQNTWCGVGQAVACETRGDKIAFYNVRMLGCQDTYYSKGAVSRVYFKNCYIEGTTDFIFGPSIALFEDCRIYCKKNSYITAASTTERNKYGYVFQNCKITASPEINKLYLGRPWHSFAKTVLMQCELDAPIAPEGWHHWIPERELTAYYAEYQCFGEGADTSKRVAWSHQLTDEEAKEYTKAQIFSKNTVSEPFYQDWLPE
ncbi:MAG: pectin methylesterase [Bacteroidales bacterium]|jgi:pectinesterase|nr:pectin methylesterase [Bacteroidales bacterium]